jgi:hypothetical protein
MATYSAETDPLDLIKQTIEDEWDHYYGKIPKPQILFWNEAGRTNARNNDYLIIQYSPTAETEEFEGHAKEYKNYTARVDIRIWTVRSRQRMHDLKAEVRRILHRKKTDLYNDGFQIISYLGFREDPDATMRNWRGTITIELSSAGIILDTGE